jgi:uncharacterized membrane protein
MKPKVFINQLEDAKIVAAITEAEQRTSGEIRVFISSHEVTDPLLEAKRQYRAMGMEKTAERNGVLIYVAPKSQNFAVVGDTAIHTKCGDEFWNSTAAAMRAHFKDGRYSEGLIAGIANIGEALARHFPHLPDDRNELPNQIEGD